MFGNEYNQIGMEMFFINTDVQLFLSVSSCVTTYLVTTAGVFKQGIYQLSEEDVPTIEPAIRHFRQVVMSQIVGLLSKTVDSKSGKYTPIIVL